MNETFIDSHLAAALPYFEPGEAVYGTEIEDGGIDSTQQAMLTMASYLGHHSDKPWFQSSRLGFFIGAE